MLLPALLAPNGQGSLSTRISNGGMNGISRRAQQEAAMRRWLLALDAVNAHISLLGTDGHARVLQAHLLLDCLRRADKLLFHSLVSEDKGAARGAGGWHDAVVCS